MSENIKSHGWRITNEQRIKVLSFLSSFDPKSEIEQRDKKILQYIFVDNFSASAVSRLNDPDLISTSNRSKGKNLSAVSILRSVYKYFPEFERREALYKPKSRDARIELRMKREKEVSKHIKQCAFCGTDKELEEHHMIPLSMGGTNDELNLIFLCKDCHKAVTSYQWSIWSTRGDVIAD